MALRLIATPIGNPGDITLRALESLKQAEVVIGEERREVSTLLKALGIEGKRMELLNEHSTDAEVRELVELCRAHEVALVTDCGTPGFCDPGARLVAACRAEGLASSPVPGASSLMCLLSVSGRDMREFLFRGFLPAEREARAAALREIERERRPVVLMDTPYRLTKLLGELAARFPERRILLGCDFTQANEQVFEGPAREIASRVGERKAEFILALFPREQGGVVGGGAAGREPARRGPGKNAPGERRRHRS
jgi:16S rRNA (cytidine1402-2'-O)-methyltransferase